MNGHAILSFYNSNSVGKKGIAKAIETIITNPFKHLVIKTIFLLEIGHKIQRVQCVELKNMPYGWVSLLEKERDIESS